MMMAGIQKTHLLLNVMHEYPAVYYALHSFHLFSIKFLTKIRTHDQTLFYHKINWQYHITSLKIVLRSAFWVLMKLDIYRHLDIAKVHHEDRESFILNCIV